MLKDLELTISAYSVLFIVALIVFTIKAYNERRIRIRAEKKAQQLIEEEKIRTSLSGKCFKVRIQSRQNKNTDMETVLIGAMTSHDLRVYKENISALGWIEIIGIYHYHVGNLEHDSCCILDVRASIGDEYCASGIVEGKNMEDLARNVLVYLSQAVK